MGIDFVDICSTRCLSESLEARALAGLRLST